MADRLDHVLDECLELLRQGVPLELCLARYPEEGEELGPLLRTALTAQAELTHAAPAQLRTRVRDRVMAEWDRRERAQQSGRWLN